MRLARAVKLVAAGGVIAGVGAAAVAAANPVARDEARRLSRLARPIGRRDPDVPVPPPLPPGRLAALAGRGEVFFRDSGGDGSTSVLLLHGWTLSADLNFFTTYGALAPRYRVVALDHRGHGRGIRSEQAFTLEDCADDAAALLAGLGLAGTVVVGYSMGGAVAMLLAQRHPELVGGVVFAGTALEWSESPRERLLWMGMSLFEVALRNGTGDGLVERILREATEECPELHPHRAWVRGEFNRGYAADLAGAGRALAAYDGRPLAAELAVPCAVVLTNRDQLVPPARQRRLAEATRATVFEFDADHFGNFKRGADFGTAIRAAVDDVAARTVRT